MNYYEIKKSVRSSLLFFNMVILLTFVDICRRRIDEVVLTSLLVEGDIGITDFLCNGGVLPKILDKFERADLPPYIT